MGVRSILPGLDLRLGRDQQCYDFCKWWVTTGQREDCDWGNMDNPYLDIKGADVFESPLESFVDAYYINFGVAVILIKVPQEVLDKVRGYLVSPVVGERKDIMNLTDQSPLIRKLEGQVQELYSRVKKSNKHFWPALLKPGKHLVVQKESHSSGSVEHMQVVLQTYFDAWVETPGAIEVIKELVKKYP
ncbi:hypothetical protein MMC26_004046 [Xylographa opegraphella]|nr:hypothetical protein [Xylographa opegraphella]